MKHHPIRYLFVITGTTRGLGKALADEALRQSGSFVVSFSRAAPSIQRDHQTIRIDLTHRHEIGPAFGHIEIDRDRLRGLTHCVLINNAGVLEPIAPLVDGDDELIAGNIQTNLVAPMILSRHFFHFCKRFPGRKWIINLTSGASQSPYYGWSAYGAAKAGIDMATRIMGAEFSKNDPDFAACAIAPGTLDTRMQEKIRRSSREQFEQVDKFIRLKETGGLDSPGHAAAKIIRLLLQGRLENGKRYDLRKLDD